MATIDIGGYTPEVVTDYETRRERDGTLGSCTIWMRATSANRSNIEAGDSITITLSGATWTGFVTGKPQRNGEELIVDGIETRLELKHEEVHQVFYEISSSEAVKRLINKRAKALQLTEIDTASGLTDWSSNAPVFEAYDGPRAGLYKWGSDLLFAGARKGHTKTITVTYDNVPSDAIEDGLFELRTRLCINNQADLFDFEVELVTGDGTTYQWTPEARDGFHSYQLKAEEASPGGQVSTNNTLQYRFIPSGSFAENRGILLDNAHTVPYRLRDRNSNVTPSAVRSTDRTIRRRVDESAAVVISNLAIEDQFDWWVDANDVLHYEPGGGASSSLSITAGSTPVVDTDFDRDFEGIRNKVTVIGAGSDDDQIEVTVADRGSIQYYGVTPRQKPITDQSLQTKAQARARGEGFLAKNAWKDILGTFSIADEAFAGLIPGQRIPVTWGPQDLDGTFVVESVEAKSNGIVDVTIGASSA